MATTKRKPRTTPDSNVPIKGVVAVTGERDSGKTTFALSCGVQPGKILFLDDDIKGRATVDEIIAKGFDMDYHDLVDLAENGTPKKKGRLKEVDFFDACMDIIDRVPEGERSVLIWDDFKHFEGCIHATVLQNPKAFRQYYSPKGDIKGGQMWQVANRVEAEVINHFVKKFDLVFLISHLKKDRVVAGRMIPDRRDPVDRKARLSVYLRSNPRGVPQPVGLILKRLSTMEVDPQKGLVPVNILPRRVDPCTWEKIREYMANPIGDREPTTDEMPNNFEFSILDGTLTDDQKDALRIERLRREEADMFGLAIEEKYDPEVVSQVSDLKGKKPPMMIARDLNLEMDQVLEILARV